ncbi:MAG: hypothetical protein HeimC2_03320 [Candidatus Heimdallarchaeota archaeon LC_2]|nr:MAG: hypothetical protein HeimC2_03320 [Candidatus Heimdallarchaeota archaeon LC_2]
MVVKLDRVRYIRVDFFGQPPSIGHFINGLRSNVRKLKGELFLATSNLHVVEYKDKYAIIKSTNKSRDTIEAALQLFDFNEFILVVKKVSGTLKSLSKTAIDEEKDEIE